MGDSNAPLPASLTKHLDELHHVLPGKRGEGCMLTLRQASKAEPAGESEGAGTASTSTPTEETQGGQTAAARAKDAGSTGTTGTTLWLGAQIMAVYLESILPLSVQPIGDATPVKPPSSIGKRKRVLELGSGIGYLSLYLASKGYDVIATDIEPSLSSVLRPNIREGLDTVRAHHARRLGEGHGVGMVDVQVIDWMDSPEVPPIDAVGSDAQVETRPARTAGPRTDPGDALRHLEHLVGDGLDMIITTDTLYAPVIVKPLWNTIYHLSHLSVQRRAASDNAGAGASTGAAASGVGVGAGISAKAVHPQIYIALENRDPKLITDALEHGAGMGFELRRVPQGKLVKALKEAGWRWYREDWDGVEVWKGAYKGKGRA